MWAPLTPQNNPSWYHHYLRFTDRQSENQSWEVTCSVSGNDYGFLRLISILYSFYSGSFISSFDSLMRGVNRLHLITSTFCQLWLVPCKPDLYPKFWMHFFLTVYSTPSLDVSQPSPTWQGQNRFFFLEFYPQICYSHSLFHFYKVSQYSSTGWAKISSIWNPTEKYLLS